MLFCAKCGRGLITTSGEDATSIPRLTWQISDGTPQTFLLTKNVTTLGRVGGNDIILTEGGVSRQHARLERSGTRCILVDLGSLNGTYVNNERIEQERDLVNGDVMRIGQTSLQILIPANVASVSAPPSGGQRLRDNETIQDFVPGGAPPLPQSALEEGPATVFDLPAVPAVAPDPETTPRPQPALEPEPAAVSSATPAPTREATADDPTVMQEVSAEDLEGVDVGQGVAHRQAEAVFWLVTGDGTRVPVEEPVTVGRGDDNTIVLSQDRQVSRHHARVSVAGDSLRLEDLGSANGTFLNGERVKDAQTIGPGDEVRIGGTVLSVERLAPSQRGPYPDSDDKTLFEQEDESEKTISGIELEEELAKLGAPPAPAAQQGIVVEAGDTPRLTITWGPDTGQSWPVDREVLVIGRTGGPAQFDIALNDRAVSSPHAKLVKSGDAYLLHDLESTNGTSLNYERLTTPRVLQDGDLIKVGKTVLLYRAAVGAVPPPPMFQVPSAGGGSQIITFFSLKGGVGTTTLAVNTALLLRALTKESVLLVDLSIERASITAHLNVEVRRALDDLGNVSVIEPEMVQGIVSHHNTGLDILPAPQSPQTAELVTAELTAQLLPVLKTQYRWIIIDTMATFTDLNLSTFDQSDLVVVVTAPDLATLKTTHACLDVFSALQTTGERRLLMMNTIYPRPRLESADMEKALGERVDLVVPYGDAVLEPVDNGTPLALTAPQHPVVMAIDSFVRKVAQIQEPVAQTRAERGGFWLKLKGMMRR